MPTFWDTHPQILGHFWKITRFCSFWYQTLPIVSQTCLPNYIILSLLSSENWLIFHFVPQTLWVDISESGHSTTLIFTFLKSAFQTLTFGICLGSQHLKVIWDFWPFLVVWAGVHCSMLLVLTDLLWTKSLGTKYVHTLLCPFTHFTWFLDGKILTVNHSFEARHWKANNRENSTWAFGVFFSEVYF